jgi:hypothetical protein
MSERLPYRVEEPRTVESWDPFLIGDVLDARAEHTADLLIGDGARYRVGPEATTHLSVFPKHNAVMVTTPEVAITMRRPSTLTMLDDTAFFDTCTETSHTTVVVGRDGTVNVIATQPLPEPLTEPEATDELLSNGNQQEARRLVLVGSVIHEPHITETHDGEPEIRFPIATATDESEYYNVYSTKKHATRIIDKDLQRGDPVKVIGVRHEFPDGDRIYAYGVKKTVGGGDGQRP